MTATLKLLEVDIKAVYAAAKEFFAYWWKEGIDTCGYGRMNLADWKDVTIQNLVCYEQKEWVIKVEDDGPPYRWHALEEGPFPSEEAAREYADAEVGVEYYVTGRLSKWSDFPRFTRWRVEAIGAFYRLCLKNRMATKAVLTLQWLLQLVQVLSILRCTITSHDMVDESYGGPDSGRMAGSCKRCGYSYHTQLY